ncbi:efflux RND transporter periplasmic adaptor subunit [Colwellia sp. MB3u-70]|uniref:efflux RND transporter periplasmic adaptor subunit n=1 Tax=unclassified Colwellia TaxID=196834 RepID=UPI0015F5D541|nr:MULTISPECIES: efflux RND transporter periplasmic adaptor subunit [unclassified Colwellia]MBA6292242.1 efflux RND transporter periplasmic adaptor subunit [Colwellia sp. MB3u-8]MBA6305748.1 efflux RND transporter periplasmic adaptor subunit [Colwellia sp. MB3u-70]
MSSNDQKSATTQSADIRQTLGIDQSTRPYSSRIKWFWAVAVIIVISIVVWQIFSDGQSQTLRYKTANVSRGSLSITVTATGTLQPVNQVEVGSEISGTISAVLVDFNDRVKQGQVLARMNTDQLQAKVNQAKASLNLARAQVKQTEATLIETKKKLSRSRELAKTGMCSEQDCDAAQASYDRAVANMESTKAQVVQAQAFLDAESTTLAKSTIHAPIDGIVLNRDVEPGQTVAASFQTPVMFTLAENLTQMELHVDVDEADVGQVVVGQDALFTVDAYANKSFPAKISEVHFASQTVNGVVTYETVLSVDNSALLLRPGMTATADILVKQVKDALLVPNAALRFSPPVLAKKTASNDNLIISLIPRRPSRTKPQDTANANNKQQKLWLLRDGQPVAIAVTTGSTDGIKTEIINGDIETDMPLIIDTISNKQ